MVSSARGLTPDQVKRILENLRKTYTKDAEYQKLRGRLPEEFPL